jgi:transcription elongation factor Elf1
MNIHFHSVFSLVPLWTVENKRWAEELSHPVAEFCCETCGKAFRNRGSLKHHWSTHRGLTKCHICGKVFARVHTLKLHVFSKHSS